MKYSAATEPLRGATVEEVRARRVDNPAICLVRYYDMLRNRAECAFGSRFVNGGRVEDYPRFKLAINCAANLFIPILFGLSYNDVTNAFKANRRPPGEVFAKWPTDGGSTP